MSLNSPVVLIVFNRPEHTRQLLEVLKQVKPSKLHIIADGPRTDHPSDILLCQEVKNLIESQVNWPCEIKKNYSEKNLGCKIRISSGLDWVFSTEERAIILEDDCIPDISFFKFCDELLEKYKNHSEISHIGGNNFLFNRLKIDDSYYFSRYTHVWGWATWQRAWQNYDVTLKQWPQIKKEQTLEKILGKQQAKFWSEKFDGVYNGQDDTWDHQWTFSSMINQKLAIVPKVNLITNIGFGKNSTHTLFHSKFANMKRESLNFPLKHPTVIQRNLKADTLVAKSNYNPFLFVKYVKKILKYLRIL
jgi:hypothetical protein